LLEKLIFAFVEALWKQKDKLPSFLARSRGDEWLPGFQLIFSRYPTPTGVIRPVVHNLDSLTWSQMGPTYCAS